MNIFFKQAMRKPIFTILMTILLSLSIALTSIGFAAWNGAKRQQEDIFNTYTTIAVPVQIDLKTISNDEFNVEVEKIGTALQNQMRADWAAQEAPQLTMIDRRCLLSAHVPGSKSISSSRMDPVEYNIVFDSECYNLSVFALRCETIRDWTAEGVLFYHATFSVEEAVSLSDAYDCFPAPDKVQIISDLREADGKMLFEAGKTYLVFGQYQDYPVYREGSGYAQNTGGIRAFIPFPELSSNSSREPSYLEMGYENGQIYHYLAQGELEWAREYTGTVEEFLAGEDASVWNEQILPICKINQESSAVVLTDSIQSMYSFNTGDTSLLSGRFFTEEEYKTGREVCIISAAFAEVNDLTLGDTVELDYYNSGHREYTNGASANSKFATADPGPFRQRNCMTPDTSIGVCKEYTIVGIYTGPRFIFGSYYFNADTIFVPKASVPNAEEYESPTNSLLNSFILNNGSADEFEAYMLEQGYGGQFLYYDQDFTSMQESLDALATNAMRLMMVGIGAFVLVCALFLFLNFRRMGAAILGVRRLGRAAGKVFAEVFAVLVAQELVAIVIGTGMASLLFDTVTVRVLSSVLTLDGDAIMAASAGAFAVLAITSAVAAAFAANGKLMKAK